MAACENSVPDMANVMREAVLIFALAASVAPIGLLVPPLHPGPRSGRTG